jgi:hypothetical protein
VAILAPRKGTDEGCLQTTIQSYTRLNLALANYKSVEQRQVSTNDLALSCVRKNENEIVVSLFSCSTATITCY